MLLLLLALLTAPARAQDIVLTDAEIARLEANTARGVAAGFDGPGLAALIGRTAKDPAFKQAVKVWGLKAADSARDRFSTLDRGVTVHLRDGAVTEVVLFRHARYFVPDRLPGDLRWGMMEGAVRERLGAPSGRNDGNPVWTVDGLDLEASIYAPSTKVPGVEVLRIRAASAPSVATARPVAPQPTPQPTTTPAVATAPVAEPKAPPAFVGQDPPEPPMSQPPPPRVARAADLPDLDSPLRTGRRAEREAAVVIGLESYAFIPGVPFARRDAGAFFDFLLYTRGIPGARAQLLTRGGREHIVAAVARAASEAGRGGRVWIYFAGHGAADPTTRERMILGDDVRADAIGFASRGVPLAELERVVADAGASPIFVLDTCYAGTGRTGEALSDTRFLVPDYAAGPAAGAPGAQWTAAGPSQLSAPLPGKDHGAFTYFALGALRGWAEGELDGRPDGRVTASEAQAFVARALRRFELADQQPAWLGPEDLVLMEGAAERAPF